MPIMNRRTVTFSLGSIALGMPSLCIAQPAVQRSLALPRGWNFAPSISVLLTEEGDPRVALVADAAAFWNNVFSELATQFRLGALTQVGGAVPVQDLKMLAANIVGTGRPARELPESVRRITGNIVVALSDGDFISLTLPNVARNVIAHEFGHAIGLSHNADPTMLMCGRPASCRPDLFTSEVPKYFPLNEAEKAHLRRMYSPSWPAPG